MRAVDTNILVRLLVRDDAAQVNVAENFVEKGAWVSHLVLVETLWVLDAVYERSPSQLAKAIDLLLNHETLTLQVHDAQILSSAQATSQVFQLSVSKFLKSEPGRLILSSARRSRLEMKLRGPESQHGSFTISGRVCLSQQYPFGPWIPGLTQV